MQQPLTKQLSVTSQKTWTISSTAVLTYNLALYLMLSVPFCYAKCFIVSPNCVFTVQYGTFVLATYSCVSYYQQLRCAL